MENYAETHTEMVDDYEERAEAADFMINHSGTFCFKGMLEQRHRWVVPERSKKRPEKFKNFIKKWPKREMRCCQTDE